MMVYDVILIDCIVIELVFNVFYDGVILWVLVIFVYKNVNVNGFIVIGDFLYDYGGNFVVVF